MRADAGTQGMAGAPGARLHHDAARAAAGLPALLLDAERLAGAVHFGPHGRRRAGHGDEFWQYRPAVAGDDARAVDWRRSARGDDTFVRERERISPQGALLWVSAAAGMGWRGGDGRPSKRHRAALIALAAAILLLRGGEGVALLGQPPKGGRDQVAALARALAAAPLLDRDDDIPPAGDLRPGQALLLLSDCLCDPAPIEAAMAAAAARGARGVLLQVTDPDEESFPWAGAIRFASASGRAWHETRDAAGLRAAYRHRLAERRERLARAATAAGFRFGCHHTGQPPAEALQWLATTLAG